MSETKMDTLVALSIVSPVYMAESTVKPLVENLINVLENFDYSPYEIILVEDGSTDNSWSEICSMADKFPGVLPVRLSRNFGQHNAIAAGLDKAKGDIVVVIDCDLQDRPDEIPKLVSALVEDPSVECVIGLRENRQDPIFKRLASSFFYFCLNIFTGIQLDSRAANFGAYSRKLINQVIKLREPDRSFPFFIHWVGFERKYIDVKHAERHSGATSYSFYKLMKLAVNVSMGVSDRPMHIVMGVGALLSASSFLFGVWLLYNYASGQISQPGYASIILSIWFFSGIMVLFLGFVGLYVGKIFLATKRRPIYIINDDTNLNAD